MNAEDKFFMQERARNLAYMYLTRRSDLLVVQRQDLEGHAETNPPFEVYLQGRFGVEPNLFWVTPIGVLKDSQESVDRDFSPEIRRLQNVEAAQATYYFSKPFFLFLFIMQEDAASYIWFNAPNANKQEPSLQPAARNTTYALDNNGLANIIAQVAYWYSTKSEREEINTQEGRFVRQMRIGN